MPTEHEVISQQIDRMLEVAHTDAAKFAILCQLADRNDLQVWATIAYMHGSLKATGDHRHPDGNHAFDADLWEIFSTAGYKLATVSLAAEEPRQ